MKWLPAIAGLALLQAPSGVEQTAATWLASGGVAVHERLVPPGALAQQTDDPVRTTPPTTELDPGETDDVDADEGVAPAQQWPGDETGPEEPGDLDTSDIDRELGTGGAGDEGTDPRETGGGAGIDSMTDAGPPGQAATGFGGGADAGTEAADTDDAAGAGADEQGTGGAGLDDAVPTEDQGTGGAGLDDAAPTGDQGTGGAGFDDDAPTDDPGTGFDAGTRADEPGTGGAGFDAGTSEIEPGTGATESETDAPAADPGTGGAGSDSVPQPDTGAGTFEAEQGGATPAPGDEAASTPADDGTGGAGTDADAAREEGAPDDDADADAQDDTDAIGDDEDSLTGDDVLSPDATYVPDGAPGFGGTEQDALQDRGQLGQQLELERRARLLLQQRTAELEAQRELQSSSLLAVQEQATENSAELEAMQQQALTLGQNRAERYAQLGQLISALESLDALLESGEEDVDAELYDAAITLEELAIVAQEDGASTEASLMLEARDLINSARTEVENEDLFPARGRLAWARLQLTQAREATGLQPAANAPVP